MEVLDEEVKNEAEADEDDLLVLVDDGDPLTGRRLGWK